MFERFSVYFKDLLKILAYLIGATILVFSVARCALETFPFDK